MSSQPPSDPWPPANSPFGPPPSGQPAPPHPFADTPPSPGYPPPYPPYGAGPATRLSMLALTSLLTAIAAPMLFCLCIPTIVFSLISVGTGVLSIYKINTSEGRLTGMPLAILGLIMSLPLLVISLVMAPAFIQGFREGVERAADSSQTAKDVLDEVEHKILTANNGIAHGNTPGAEELAREYAETMKLLRESFFTEEKRKIVSLSDGEFITWCELRDNQCAFVVHVPSYRKFDDDAKEALAELAWMSAQQAVREKLQPGDDLAVGLRGSLLYGSVQVGKVVAEGSDDDGITYSGDDPEMLHPFFEPEEAAEDEADENPFEMEIEVPEGFGEETP